MNRKLLFCSLAIFCYEQFMIEENITNFIEKIIEKITK